MYQHKPDRANGPFTSNVIRKKKIFILFYPDRLAINKYAKLFAKSSHKQLPSGEKFIT